MNDKTWKEIELNGKLYFISNYGDVKSTLQDIKTREDCDGYLIFTGGKSDRRSAYAVHRLVAKLFLGEKPCGCEVNHIDFDRKNNYYKNLEWVSHKENVMHSRKHNRYNGLQVGTKNIKCRLSEQDVIEIRKMIKDGKRTCKIANLYNIGWSTVYNIKINNTWKHI